MLFLFLILLASIPCSASAQSSTPAFDVASVRPSPNGASQHSNVPLDAGNVYSTLSAEDARTAAGGYLIATHQPLWRYVAFAYKLSGTQELALRFSMFSGAPKSNAPTWVTGSFTAPADAFDISARAPADTSIDTMRLMMRSLLAERFHLALHTTAADTAVFALSLLKAGSTGPNLRAHPATDACDTASPVGDLPHVCGVIARVVAPSAGQHYGGRGVPLQLLATSIPTMTGLAAMPRPVVDATGLTGLYDFTLSWSHDATSDAAISDNADNFRQALKTQLGLDLKPSHATIEFIVIDHVEKPSDN